MLLFKRKNLIILTLALICTALMLCFFCIYNNEKPVQAETATEAAGEPTAHDDAPHCTHGTPLTAGGTLTSGDYYLTGDLTITSQISIAAGATVNICLNGYMLVGSARNTIEYTNGTLNLYDCGNNEEHKHYYTKDENGRFVFGEGEDYITGGVITSVAASNISPQGVCANSGNSISNMYGGTVAGCYWGVAPINGDNSVIFNMYAGKICGNSGSGIVVQQGSIANLYGGEIVDNGGGGKYGGVMNNQRGTITVQGDIKIYGNVSSEGNVINIKIIDSTSLLTVGSEGLSEDATIGITVCSGQTYADGDFFTNNSSQSTFDLLNNYLFDDSTVHDHDYGTLIARQEPTCTADGHEAYYQCSICGKYFDLNKNVVEYDGLVIPALGHSYALTNWQWASDYSSATATYTCANCGDTDTQTVTPTKVQTDPTCTVDGTAVYTATVTLPDGTTETDTQTVTLPATGHSYSVTSWQWASDYSSVTVTYVCANCGDTDTQSVTPTSTKTDPDCTTDGSIVYTATVTLPDGTTETDTATETLPATGHSYSVTSWQWASDYSTATATYVCANCGDTGTVTGTSTYVTTDPTCDTDGLIGYTVTVTLPDGTTATDNNGQTLPAIGHQWDSGTVVPPTCTTDGYTEYTCTVCGESKQDEVVPATGHTYQLSGWKWADDYSSASVEFVCSVCGDKITYPADSVTYEDDDSGLVRTYTATVTVEGNTFTDVQIWNIPQPPKPVIDPDIGDDGKFKAEDEDGNEIDLDDYIDYTYYDPDGNEVDPDDFVDGTEYTAVPTVKPGMEEEFKNAFENGEQMYEYINGNTFTFVYHAKKSGCAGCVGGIDWILVLCIGLLLFDVVMFAITMRVICSKPKDDDDDEEEAEADGEFY